MRRIIWNSIAFEDFVRCFLTKPQKALLSRQRTRIGQLDSDQDIDTNMEGEDEPLGKFIAGNLEAELAGFEPKSSFDKKLLLGVLFEKGKIPQDIKKETHELSEASIIAFNHSTTNLKGNSVRPLELSDIGSHQETNLQSTLPDIMKSRVKL